MNRFFIFCFAFLILNIANQAWSWGGRGHDAICRTATFLVKSKELGAYLKQKPQMMGHLCNIPDFYWKGLGGDSVKLGNPTHFIDVEITGKNISEVPEDFVSLVTEYQGKPNLFKNDGSVIKNFPSEFGSIWWRADQFMRKISNLKADFASATPPTNYKEEQNYELPYNQRVYDMITFMGLMGHFVGDNSQPFHVTADYDGFHQGHGGIHAFYEDEAVALFDGDLEFKVLKEARALVKKNEIKKMLGQPDTIKKMKALSEISKKEISILISTDPLIEKSVDSSEKGKRKSASRKDADLVFKKWEKLIITQMARSTVLLAALWDEAYVSAGTPSLKNYKSYKYPFTVEFIPPDYFTISKEEKPEKL